MPTLSIQLVGQGKDANGRPVTVPSSIALIQRGPAVQVSITVDPLIAAPIVQRGGTLPPPVTGLALIDTGASNTCIDEEAATDLQLPAIDVVNVSSASHSSTQQNVYPIQIEVVGIPIKVSAARAIGAPLKVQGLIALIGRDILQHSVFVYNGMTGSFSFSI